MVVFRQIKRHSILPLAGLALGGSLIFLLHAPMLSQVYHNVAFISAPATIPSQAAAPEWKNPLWPKAGL